MELAEVRRNWEEFGRTDPLWAILTDPAKRHNRWDRREFFQTGELEIECLMDYVGTLPVRLDRRAALDFGCGVGRLAQALCRYFREVDGVDIAESMVALARTYNEWGDRCRYHVNEAADLRLFAADRFDLVYSNIVLQHVEPRYSREYIREFVRVLAPGGLAIFQAPSEAGGRSPGRPSLDGLFNAVIAPPQASLAGVAGSRLEVGVRVRNASAHLWPGPRTDRATYRIRLGNHWLGTDGRVLQQDDGRIDLPGDLAPSAEVELRLIVTLPPTGGDYVLELDMVQEGVAWFKDRGSRAVTVPVQVTGASGVVLPAADPSTTGRPPRPAPGAPVMEMHCLPRAVVLDSVAREGGRLLDVQEYGAAGPTFVGYRYCVTK